MEHRIIVVGVVKKGTKILLGQKPPGKGPYPDTWHLPGGGINFGEETCEEAVQREIKEEAGIEVTNVQKASWDTDIEPNKHGVNTYYIFLDYTADYKQGELLPGDDMHHFEWVDKDKLLEYKLNKPSKILLKKLGYLS